MVKVHTLRQSDSLIPDWYFVRRTFPHHTCSASDSVWYCIRGLRPKSPKTTTQARLRSMRFAACFAFPATARPLAVGITVR